MLKLTFLAVAWLAVIASISVHLSAAAPGTQQVACSGSKVLAFATAPSNEPVKSAKLGEGQTITVNCTGTRLTVWQVSKAGYDKCAANGAKSKLWVECSKGEVGNKTIPATAFNKTDNSTFFKGSSTHFIASDARAPKPGSPAAGVRCLAGQKIAVNVIKATKAKDCPKLTTPTKTPGGLGSMTAEPTARLDEVLDMNDSFKNL